MDTVGPVLMSCTNTIAMDTNLDIMPVLVSQKPIGSGSFSRVYKAKYKNKIIALKRSRDLKWNNFFKIEAEILKQLSHKNIVSFFDYMEYNSCGSIICMEYYAHKSLGVHLKGGVFEEKSILIFLPQIISALEYAHSKLIAHHDIKPDNILVNEKDGTIKLIDWGLSVQTKTSNDMVEHFNGSPLYLPPEVIMRIPYNPFQCDLWQLGITLYELAYNSPLHQSKTYDCLVKEILTFKIPVFIDEVQSLSLKFKNVIVDLLQQKPDKRITLKNMKITLSHD